MPSREEVLDHLRQGLESLQRELVLIIDEGPLRQRLIELCMEREDRVGELLESDHRLSLRIEARTALLAPRCVVRLDAREAHCGCELSLSDLIVAGEGDSGDGGEDGADALLELSEYLRPYLLRPARDRGGPARKILRKGRGSAQLNIAAAARALSLSHRSLKGLIPCSDMRILPQGIGDYVWDSELIARFQSVWEQQQQGGVYRSADLEFIAAACYDGDSDWARQSITRFFELRSLRTTGGDEDG